MKTVIVFITVLIFQFFPSTIKAQNYLLEVNPRFFAAPNVVTARGGLSLDANVAVSKIMSLGVSGYVNSYHDQMMGVNIGLNSNRQSKFGYYGKIKLLYAIYSPESTRRETGIGANLGAGAVYNMGRKVGVNVELSYPFGSVNETINFSQPETYGFKGPMIEGGLVFKMIRKN